MAEAPASKSTPPPDLILDRSVLDALKDCLSQADLSRLLDQTATEFPALHERISAAWRAGDLIGLAHQAHKLTGVAASFGAAALSAAADLIERECRTAQQAPCVDLLDDLANAIDPALQAIADWRAEQA